MSIKMKNGKSYLTVVERMNMLLKDMGKENYSLETEVKYESGIVIVKAILTLFLKNANEDAGITQRYCGHALGELGKAKTLEATETHAIGRALSSAGYFGDEFASANEMESWTQPDPIKLKDQEVKIDIDPNLATDKQTGYIKMLCEKTGTSESSYDFITMTKQQASEAIEHLGSM